VPVSFVSIADFVSVDVGFLDSMPDEEVGGVGFVEGIVALISMDLECTLDVAGGTGPSVAIVKLLCSYERAVEGCEVGETCSLGFKMHVKSKVRPGCAIPVISWMLVYKEVLYRARSAMDVRVAQALKSAFSSAQDKFHAPKANQAQTTSADVRGPLHYSESLSARGTHCIEASGLSKSQRLGRQRLSLHACS